MGNNAKAWIAIGVIIIIIGLALTISFSIMSEKQIDLLVEGCIKNGGEPLVEKEGFIVTTSYQFECKK